MIYLLGAIAANAVFAQTYKLSVARGYDVDWVCMLSFASSALLVLVIPGGATAGSDWRAAALGVAYGVLGWLSQVAFFRALGYGPLSVSYTITALCVLVPILGSILLWNEHPTLGQGFALVGTVLAVALMGDVEIRRLRQPLSWAVWVGLSFLASGLAGLDMKAMASIERDGSRRLFLLVGYAASVLLSLPLLRRHRLGWPEALAGCTRGAAILLANWLLLAAASLLDGYVVFAVYGASLVTVNVVAAILFWGERPRGRALGGIVLAVAAIVLFNV
jgi:drug/metabolite transporter (DMT)-like permease